MWLIIPKEEVVYSPGGKFFPNQGDYFPIAKEKNDWL